MKKETFILLFSIIFVFNSYGQCPKAEMYKRKSEKAFNDGNKAMRNNPTLVGANYNSNQMGAPDAYIILSAYEAYVCQCKNQNNGKKATELKNFINREYVQRYASMVSKYGSMPRITSCKGGNSKDKTASLKNSNRNSSTNSNPLITSKDISDFLKGNKKERENVFERVKHKYDINNIRKSFNVNQQEAELIDATGKLIGKLLFKQRTPEEIARIHKNRVKEWKNKEDMITRTGKATRNRIEMVQFDRINKLKIVRYSNLAEKKIKPITDKYDIDTNKLIERIETISSYKKTHTKKEEIVTNFKDKTQILITYGDDMSIIKKKDILTNKILYDKEKSVFEDIKDKQGKVIGKKELYNEITVEVIINFDNQTKQILFNDNGLIKEINYSNNLNVKELPRRLRRQIKKILGYLKFIRNN